MNALNLLKGDVFKPLVTLIIPGAVAIIPGIYLFCLLYSSVKVFVEASLMGGFISGLSVVLFVVSCLVIGLILDFIGLRLQDLFTNQIKNYEDIFTQYLQQNHKLPNIKKIDEELENKETKLLFTFNIVASILFFCIPQLFLIINIHSNLGYSNTIQLFRIGILSLFILAIFLISIGIMFINDTHYIRLNYLKNGERQKRPNLIRRYKGIVNQQLINSNTITIQKLYRKSWHKILIISVIYGICCLVFSSINTGSYIVFGNTLSNNEYVVGDNIDFNVQVTNDIKSLKLFTLVDQDELINDIQTIKEDKMQEIRNGDVNQNQWLQKWKLGRPGSKTFLLKGYSERIVEIDKNVNPIKIEQINLKVKT